MIQPPPPREPEPLKSLRARFESICQRLGVRCDLVTVPQHDGSAHVELQDRTYHYVVTERGAEFERRKTADPDEVLYWLASDVVFSLACEFELRNRDESQDFRRILFAKNIELMNLLSPEWGRRTEDKHREILVAHPFIDRNAKGNQDEVDPLPDFQ